MITLFMIVFLRNGRKGERGLMMVARKLRLRGQLESACFSAGAFPALGLPHPSSCHLAIPTLTDMFDSHSDICGFPPRRSADFTGDWPNEDVTEWTVADESSDLSGTG